MAEGDGRLIPSRQCMRHEGRKTSVSHHTRAFRLIHVTDVPMVTAIVGPSARDDTASVNQTLHFPKKE